jgi:hypothetical protein
VKDVEEIHQALLDGKTLISKAGIKVDIGNSQQYVFDDCVEDWEIYELTDTCGGCSLRGGQECPMVFYCDDLGLVDKSEYNGYCHKFRRKDR